MAEVKAWVMVEPGKLELQSFPRPEVASDSLLMKVVQLGLCGTDKHMLMGHTPLNFPVIPGHEVVGIVEEIGPDANSTMNVIGGPLQEGNVITVVPSSKGCGKCIYCLRMPHRPALCMNRTVYGFSNCDEPPHLTGHLAEHVYVHGNSWVYKIADEVPESRRVLAEPTAVATRAVERSFAPGIAQIGAGHGIGSTVVVLGAGPIGLLVTAVLRHTGAGTIITTDAVDDRLQMAKRMGADVTLDVTKTSLAERTEAIQDLSEGMGADIVFECAGVPGVFAEALELVRRAGIVMEIGHYTDSGEVSIHPHQICKKDIDVRGVWAYPQIQFKTALEFLRHTTVPVEELATHYLPMHKVPEGLALIGKEGVYKVVIEPHQASA